MDEFITTTGNGAASTGPDAMRVGVAVEASAPTVAEALAMVAEAARRATEVARRHTESNHIASQGFRVHPSHDHRGRADGYAASHALRIHCQLADAGALVSDLGESVGDTLRVHDVGPVLTDTGELRHRARELAFADAQAKAVHLAQLAGRSLGRALQVREGGPNHSPVPMAAPLAHESVGFEQGGGAGDSDSHGAMGTDRLTSDSGVLWPSSLTGCGSCRAPRTRARGMSGCCDGVTAGPG
ncbi:MAG: SIMPL domain-containing protein [Nocardioides sp.]